MMKNYRKIPDEKTPEIKEFVLFFAFLYRMKQKNDKNYRKLTPDKKTSTKIFTPHQHPQQEKNKIFKTPHTLFGVVVEKKEEVLVLSS